MKVLIGVDDSRHARAALDYVKAAPWPRGTTVHLVSVARPALAAATEIYAPAPEYMEKVQEEQIKLSHDVVNKAKEHLAGSDFAVETHVLTGDPREGLLDTARGVGADMIVVGSHGRAGLSKLLMGSVASHIVTHAHCNVLVVKLPEKATA